MKILHLTHWFPSERNKQSGIFVKDYIQAIHGQEPENALILFLEICKGRSFWPKKEVFAEGFSGNIRMVKIKLSSFPWKVFYVYPQLQWFFLGSELRKVVSDFRPEMVHAHVVHPSGALAYKLCQKTDLPLVITEHWSNLRTYFRRLLSSAWGRKSYTYATAVLPVSEFLRSNILQLLPRLNPEKVIVVPDVVDEKLFFYAPQEDKGEHVLKFLAVSSWNRYKQISKRPDLIISGLASFARMSGKEVHLTIVGDGSMLEEMHELAKKEGLRVDFVGRKTKPEIAVLLNSTDYFIHASNVETFSLVTAEALMTGTPSIVSNAGALPDLVTEERGVVCQNTLNDWTAGLQMLTSRNYNRQKIASDFRSVCSYSVVSSKVNAIYSGQEENI